MSESTTTCTHPPLFTCRTILFHFYRNGMTERTNPVTLKGLETVNKTGGSMLSAERQETLTRVGRGTPMGELLRRYWFPVAATCELRQRPIKAVRLLGERLVLFRDASGRLGLLDEHCPHRGTSLAFGMVDAEGIR